VIKYFSSIAEHFSLSGVLLILAALFFIASNTRAQEKRATILYADSITGGTLNGKEVQRILGDVHIRHKNLEIHSDSAHQFINQNKVKAYGNIELDTGTEMIWSDRLTYFTDRDFSKLRGRVIISTDSTTLFGNSIDYSFETKKAHFLDRIRYEDQRGTLKADSGFYFRKTDSLRFYKNVQIADSLQYLEGDSLFGNRRAGYYELHGQVFGDDEENSSKLVGDYLETDSTGRRLLIGDAWLQNFESDTTDTTQTDTTHILAKKIISQEQRSPKDTTAIIHAYEKVRVWSPDFSAIADTAQYIDSTQTFELWSNAKSWHKQVQLTGPYIKAILDDGDIDSLISHPNPFSVQQDTTIDRLNQITGDTLHADFTDGNLSEIHVFQNAKLLRFTKNEQDSSDGAIELEAPSIRILFEEGELTKLIANGNNSGSFLPENEETANKKMDGFAWNPEQRPEKPANPMQRRFPPIENKVFFTLPYRYLQYLEETDPNNPHLPDVNQIRDVSDFEQSTDSLKQE